MKCEICDRDIDSHLSECEYQKNGYCAVSLKQSEIDAIKYNMRFKTVNPNVEDLQELDIKNIKRHGNSDNR